MLNEKGIRQLAYIVTIDEIRPIEGYDKVEYARVGGWWVIVGKDQFKVGDPAIYFEVDSKVPAREPFLFLDKRNFKIKTLKMCKVISQGLLMEPADFGWTVERYGAGCSILIHADKKVLTIGDSVMDLLGVTYAETEDNTRKAEFDKTSFMKNKHSKFFKTKFGKFLLRHKFTRNLTYSFFRIIKREKSNQKAFPTHFAGVSKTDQERCENMPYILDDKTPYIVTQKCDGSSATYILERKGKKKFEFYVCSRNVRMLKEEQECYYGARNYYWEMAKKYNIEDKLKDYLEHNPDITFVCWQGEICAPEIQKNPHKLKEPHFFAFHMTDSKRGRWDIREAAKLWESYEIEHVPIISDNYILPSDFEYFKETADGYYDPSVCEGNTNCPREGYVYYRTTDPTFSFKNVSRPYLLKHNG